MYQRDSHNAFGARHQRAGRNRTSVWKRLRTIIHTAIAGVITFFARTLLRVLQTLAATAILAWPVVTQSWQGAVDFLIDLVGRLAWLSAPF